MTTRLDDLCWICDVQYGITMGGGGGPSGNTTTVQKSDPWSGQQPYLEQGFQGAQNLYQGPGPQYYPGQTLASVTPQQNQAISDMATIAGPGGSMDQTAGQAGNFANGLFSGAYMNGNPGSIDLSGIASGGFYNPANPALTGLTYGGGLGENTLGAFSNGDMLSAGNPYFSEMADNIKAQVLPGLEGQFTQGGGMNNANAQYSITHGLSDAIGNLAFQNYEQGLGQMQNAASTLGQEQLGAGSTLGQDYLGGLGAQISAGSQLGQNYNSALDNMTKGLYFGPELQQMELAGPQALYSAGAQEQALNQAAINDAVQRFSYAQELPYLQLANFMNTVQGQYGNTSTLTQPYFQNGTANMLGGLAGGAMTGAMLGSVVPGIGTAAGAVGGGLIGGLMSL